MYAAMAEAAANGDGQEKNKQHYAEILSIRLVKKCVS
jgi:hypothetical protein